MSCSRTFFLDAKKKFETARGVLRKEKITIDPEDPAAVSQYAEVMNTSCFQSVRELTIKYSIATQTAHIEDVRTHMLALKEIRIKRGLTVELGAEAMMMAASENVQKK
ncbi:putative ATP synthase 24 kDa subunit, mitochondrial [Apium graveolens]|uniref:putative ATP synthase 24 kDa subunit, mitochondrial n=1 Tax=Apium graveolens TaxID=4045 RepID=UPI003D7B15E6